MLFTVQGVKQNFKISIIQFLYICLMAFTLKNEKLSVELKKCSKMFVIKLYFSNIFKQLQYFFNARKINCINSSSFLSDFVTRQLALIVWNTILNILSSRDDFEMEENESHWKFEYSNLKIK